MTSYEPTNDDRAERCEGAFRDYGTDDTLEGCLIDLLTDARHWCDRHGFNYAEFDRLAYQHYATEVVAARRGDLEPSER